MVALKLVRLIEKHSEELVRGLAEHIRTSERMSDFRNIPPADLELAAVEVIATWANGCCKKQTKILRGGLGQSPHAAWPGRSASISLSGP